MSDVTRLFGTQNLTQEQLKAMSPQALVTLHNQLNPSKPVNRFSDRKTAEKRVWALGSVEKSESKTETVVTTTIDSAHPEKARPKVKTTPPSDKTPKVKSARKPRPRKAEGERGIRLKTFRLAPEETIREPREGTKRAEVLRLLGRENGAKFSEIMEKVGWDEKTAYEGIRLIHVQCGYGLYHVNLPNNDYRIYLARNMKEFRELAAKYKEA